MKKGAKNVKINGVKFVGKVRALGVKKGGEHSCKKSYSSRFTTGKAHFAISSQERLSEIKGILGLGNTKGCGGGKLTSRYGRR